MNPEINKLRTLADNMGTKLLPVMENLTKKDVYVVVDTPKKAKKLKRLLDMFGERYGCATFDLIEDKSGNELYLNHKQWNVDCVGYIDKEKKSKVSIKELRDILAKEHLSTNDVIICKIGDTEYIVEFDSFKNNNLFGKRYITIHKDGTKGDIITNGAFCTFKRYATPEEIDLLETKNKELEVGKWYKYPDISNWMVCVNEFNNSFIRGYGFNSKSGWMSDGKWMFFEDNLHLLVEATPQEVEQALIEEAKRRGYREGVTISTFMEGARNYKLSDYPFSLNHESYNGGDEYGLRFGGACIYSNGQWATIIEQDKFAELKEAHKNGAVIQFRNSSTFGKWLDLGRGVSWNPNNEYRIKPEEKPKVGDVVKAWDNESDAYTVGKVIEIGGIGYFLQDDLWWDNAKTLTQQEAIDLLFRKEPSNA